MSKRHQHHGGAWKTAYADFVTAMMALFLLLWLTAQDKKIKEAVERAFRNPFSAVNKESTGILPSKDTTAQNKTKGSFESVTAVEMQMLRKVTEDIAKMLQQSQELEQSVQIELTPDGVRINVFDHSQKPIFEPGTSKFTPYGSWVFSTLAWEIARFQTFRIELEGHTETKPDADAESLNKWDLSTERANAARRQLVDSGVTSDQIYKVSGFADTQPMPGLASDAESNRRVTVLLKVENLDESETPGDTNVVSTVDTSQNPP
ncbi:MAG: flagellar motor protein MotB [Limisphaerales bacterium]